MRTAARETAFQITLRNCSKEVKGGARIYRSFATKGRVVGNVKRILLIKENQVSQGLQRFSVYGKIQESGLTEIIPLICTSAIWGQYPVFSHPEFP